MKQLANRYYVLIATFLSVLVVISAFGSVICPVPAVQGTQPYPSQIKSTMERAAQNQLGSDGPAYPTMGKGYPTVTSVPGSVPCIILKSVGYIESASWRQFQAQPGQSGPTVISGDCGYGIMQITSGMDGSDPGFVPQRVAAEYVYNIGTGARALIRKWNASPSVGDNDPQVAEDWYFAVWAYNGFSYQNNPNNPKFPANRPPYNGTSSTPNANYPYQERVWGRAANPPSPSTDYWDPMPLTLVNRALIPNSGVPASSQHFSRPSPSHGTGCPQGSGQGTCSTPINLTAGQIYNGNTSGGQSSFPSYNCSTWNESGPERVHRITLNSPGTITASLSNYTSDVDVFILSSCSSSSCLAFGNVTAQASVGAGTYYIVVDGYNGAISSYTLTVNVTGSTPAISVTPSSLSFGSVAIGSSATLAFTVKNTGGGTLSGSATVPSPFSIASGGSYNLGANATQTVTVRFSPTAPQSYSQNVTFTGGGGASRPVSGSAALPPTIAWEFNTSGNYQGWVVTNAAHSVNSGALFIDPYGSDPYVSGPSISASAAAYKYVQLVMASNALDGNGMIYFKTQAENFYSEDKKVTFSVNYCRLCNNAPFYPYTIFMGGNSKWAGTITGIRLDPASNGSSIATVDTIGIDYIRLTP